MLDSTQVCCTNCLLITELCCIHLQEPDTVLLCAALLQQQIMYTLHVLLARYRGTACLPIKCIQHYYCVHCDIRLQYTQLQVSALPFRQRPSAQLLLPLLAAAASAPAVCTSTGSSIGSSSITKCIDESVAIVSSRSKVPVSSCYALHSSLYSSSSNSSTSL
jgi:hypothetical protein